MAAGRPTGQMVWLTSRLTDRLTIWSAGLTWENMRRTAASMPSLYVQLLRQQMTTAAQQLALAVQRVDELERQPGPGVDHPVRRSEY